MRLKYLGAAAAALLFSTPAEAATWVKIVTSKDGLNTIWVDSSRIIRGDESTMMWSRLSLGRGNYAVTLSAVRCESHTYMDLKQLFFDARGVSTEMDVSKTWKVAVPETLIDSAISYVCPAE